MLGSPDSRCQQTLLVTHSTCPRQLASRKAAIFKLDQADLKVTGNIGCGKKLALSMRGLGYQMNFQDSVDRAGRRTI